MSPCNLEYIPLIPSPSPQLSPFFSISSSISLVMSDQVSLSKDMASANIQAPDAQPEPADFKPRDNPAFILHGKLKTSYGEVSSAQDIVLDNYGNRLLPS